MKPDHSAKTRFKATSKPKPKILSEGDSYHQLFAGNSSAMLLIDAVDGAIIEANRAAQRFYGYSREQLLAMRIFQINTRSAEEIRRDMEAMSSEEGRRFEYRHRLADGSVREVEVSSTRLQINGRDLRLAIIYDVTVQRQAGIVLARNAARLRRAEQVAGIGHWEINLATGEMEASSNARLIYGFSGEKIVPADIRARSLPEYRARLDEALHDLIEAGRPYDVEFRIRRATDGEIRDIHSIAEYDPANRTVLGVLHDITVRRLDQAARRASEEKYRQLFESMLDGFSLHEIICDSAGRPVDYRFLTVNPSFERLTGLRAADVIGRTVREVMPATEAKWIERYGRVALTGEGVEFSDYSAVLQRHFEISAFRPKPGQFATVFIDITEQVRAVQSLREREERYHRITEAITDYIYTVQVQEGRAVATRHGPGCHAVTGYQPEEFAAEADLWITMVAPEDRPAVEEHARHALTGANPPPLEHRLLHKSGAMLWVSNTTVPHRDDQGRLVAYDGLIRDITARKLAETALQESNYFLQKAHEIARIGSYKFDIPRGRWTSSPQLDEIFGIDEHFVRDVAGWIDLVIPAQREGMAAYLRDHVLDRRQRFDREYAVIRPSNGQLCWVYGTGELEFDATGRPRLMFGTIQDITSRRKSEQSLRESENNLQEAQKLAGIGSWQVEFGPDGERWNGSPELRCIYGRMGPVPLPDNFWFDVVHPDDRNAVDAIWSSFLRGECPGDMEHRIVVGGQVKWVYVRARLRRDSATGQPVEITGTSQDITARKLAESDHARLVTAVAQAAETIVITDTDGTIVYANPAFEKTSGYTCAEAIGLNPRILKSGRHDARHYREMWDCLRRGEVWTGHFINRRKDGSLFEEEATISPVRDAGGRIVNYVAVKRDVTREVLLDAQFRQAQKMEAVGQLAGGVAHDFNNILAAVLMHIGLLQMEAALDTFTRNSLNELSKEVQRGAGLTRQLLAFSRQQAMEPCRIDLHAVVNGLLAMLRRLLGEHIAIELLEAAGEVPIEADAGMIEQVVINLCINARDAMPGGGRLVLRTEVIEIAPLLAPEPGGARPGRFARLMVSDTGTGMSAETLQHIFEPFFTTKEKGKGTGLGLATVYGIVQQHDGWVTVESTVGTGTSFYVHLPASETGGDQLQAIVAAAPARGRDETILVVEDENSLRTTLAATLRHHGYKVLEAADGPAALDHWKNQAARIGLVLTDIVLPGGMSGHELIQRLLADKPGLKIIATTGYSPQDPRIHSTLDNRIVVLSKPFAPNRLLGLVRARLDQA